MKLLGNLKRGLSFILSAPSGTGKTTLVRMLTEEFSCVKESISCTTRDPRPLEVNGIDYHFLTRKEFTERRRSGEFLEHAEVFGDEYGTSASFVENELARGHHVILIIDTQGFKQIQNRLDAVSIFVTPPSMKALEQRLKQRRTETPQRIKERLSWAKEEMAQVVNYDYHIVNDNLHTAYQTLRSIVIAEEHRVSRE